MTPSGGWPAGRPRILCTDAWLANAGDAAIALGLDRLIRSVAPTAAVVHAAYQADAVGPLLGDLSLVPPLEDLLGTPWAPPAPGWEEQGAALVDGADLVICQGGGFLVEAYEPLGRLAALADAARRAQAFAMVGLTVEPFRRAVGRRLLREVCAAAQLVVVRDPASVLHARELGAADAWLGTDLALALFDAPPTDDGDRPARAGVSVVLTDHHPDPERRASMAASARVVLDAVLAVTPEDEPVTTWSTVQGLPAVAREDDAALAQRLLVDLPTGDRARVEPIEGYVSPQAAIERVAHSRALITMRLHPGLFAAATGTPFALVLGGQRPGVVAGIALTGRIARPGDAAAIRAVVEQALADTAPAPRLWEELAPLRARLDQVHEALVELIERCPVG